MKKILTILVVLVLLILWLWVYFGFFSEIKFEDKQTWPYDIIYKIHTWDYTKLSEVFTEIDWLLFKNWVESIQGIGVYFSDPKTVIKENMVSVLWFVTSGMTQEQFDNLKLLDSNLRHSVLNITDSVVTSFPYKNNVSLMIWPMVMYPKIDNYMIQNNMKPVPIMEIYDIQENKKIYFIVVKDENYYNSLLIY